MLVCFEKGAYADTIGRIQRLEEAIGQLLFFRFLDEKGLIRDQHKVLRIRSSGEEQKVPFEKFLKHGDNKAKLLVDRFPEILAERQPGDFYFKVGENVPLRAVANGKNFYYFLFKSFNRHEALYQFWEIPNGTYHRSNNPLANLRNHSIVGHGFKGVSKEDLTSVVGDFSAFSEEVHALIEKNLSCKIEHVFKKLNEKINYELFQ
jgi:hypothetical protein